MNRSLRALYASVLAMSVVAGAQAQEAQTPSAVDETSQAETAQVDQPSAEQSTDEAKEPQLGEPYVVSSSGDWETRCLKTPEGQPDPCQLYQLLYNEDNRPIAEFTVFPLEDRGQVVAGATAVVPLETLLPKQLTMQIGKGESRIYPFSFCNLNGCVARIGLRQEDINALKKGNTAILSMFRADVPDQPIALNASLKGFTAGYNALKAQ